MLTEHAARQERLQLKVSSRTVWEVNDSSRKFTGRDWSQESPFLQGDIEVGNRPLMWRPLIVAEDGKPQSEHHEEAPRQ